LFRFQSLFSWMFRSKTSVSSSMTGSRGVSILVLVDVSFEAWFIACSRVRIFSFNPCSRGCFVRRPSTPRAGRLLSCFNPCSRGCFVRRYEMTDSYSLMGGFNPCSRGCFVRRTTMLGNSETDRVSILVLVDVSFEVRDRPHCSRGRGFQSLFSWMFRSKTVAFAAIWVILGFQSLFSWMFRSKDSHSVFYRAYVQFQSLFSWMFRSKPVW